MKKQFLFATLALATMFTACSKEEELSKNEGGTPVNFVIGGIGARTATTLGQDGTYSTKFNIGDKIGIYATGGATITNQLLTVAAGDGDSQILQGDAITYEEGVAATFKAYYPYKEGDAETVTMTVGNQADGIDDYDFLIATPAAISSDSEVTLSFTHQLAMVQVQVVGTIGANATSVTLKNIKPSVTWNVTTDSPADAYDDPIDITMYRIDETNNIYVALVPVQNIQSTAMFSTTIGTKTYIFTPKNTVSLTANTVSKFKIEIGETATMTTVSSVNFSIGGWSVSTTEVGNDDFTMTEETIPAIELISATDFSNATLGTTVGGLSSMTSVGWAKVGPETNSTVTLSNGTLSIANSNSSSYWYNRAVVCRTNVVTKAANYKLSFNLNSDNNLGDGLQVSVMVPETTTNTFYKINTSSDKVYPTPKTELYTYTVDLNTIDNSGVLIMLTPKTDSETGVTYTITNLTFVEVQE